VLGRSGVKASMVLISGRTVVLVADPSSRTHLAAQSREEPVLYLLPASAISTRHPSSVAGPHFSPGSSRAAGDADDNWRTQGRGGESHSTVRRRLRDPRTPESATGSDHAAVLRCEMRVGPPCGASFGGCQTLARLSASTTLVFKLWRATVNRSEMPAAGFVDSHAVKTMEDGGLLATTPARRPQGARIAGLRAVKKMCYRLHVR
jgi:hypothetical protein